VEVIDDETFKLKILGMYYVFQSSHTEGKESENNKFFYVPSLSF